MLVRVIPVQFLRSFTGLHSSIYQFQPCQNVICPTSPRRKCQKKNGASVFRGSFHIFSIFPKPCPSPGDPLARFTGRSQSCGSSSARTRKLRASVEPRSRGWVARMDVPKEEYTVCMYVYMYVCMCAYIYIIHMKKNQKKLAMYIG